MKIQSILYRKYIAVSNEPKVAIWVEYKRTTAGYKNTFAYDKLIQTLIRMVIEPEKAFIMGGTYRIPVATGLISKNFVNDLKQDGTFNEATFDREYKTKLYSLNIVNCWNTLRAA